MRFPARLIVPVLAALLLVGSALGYAWWQLRETEARLRQEARAAAEMESLPGGTGSGTVRASPEDAGDIVLIRLRQGDLLALQGEWASAEREYQASVDAGGGIPALRKLAQAQMQRREIEKVRGTIQKLRDAGARDEDLLLLSVIIDLRTGRLVQAQQAVAAAPDSPQKHYGLALLSLIQGNHDETKKELKLVIGGWDPTLRSYARTLQAAYDEFALFPENNAIHLTTLLSRALAQTQECELALPLLGGVLSKQADYRDAWTVQGYCELTTERFNDALASFEKAYSIDPEKPEIQYFLGRTYMVLGQWKNAATFLQYALVNGFEPKKEVRRRLVDAAIQAGNKPLALDQSAALIPEPDADPGLFETVITLAIQLEKKEDAYQYAQVALTKWPDSPKILDLAGWAAMETDRPDEARTALEKAVRLDPDLESARTRLEELNATQGQ